MTPDIYEDVLTEVQREAQAIHDLHRLTQELGSDWSKAQLKLFLTCMDGVEVGAEGLVQVGEQRPEEALLAALCDVVKSRGGKPIPAAQVLRLLPSQFVTTEAQIKSIAKGSNLLEVFGPGLLRLK